jgi:hypothetical protein
MAKYLILILIICGCSNTSTVKISTVSQGDSIQKRTVQQLNESRSLQEILNTADSIIIASHYSPYEPIRDEKTSKYLPPFEVVTNGKLNESIVQEHKKLNRKDIHELSTILADSAIGSNHASLCFQPRHGIFAYKAGKLSYLDVCFECRGFDASQDIGSKIVIDDRKYEKLLQFYKKRGFHYMLDYIFD